MNEEQEQILALKKKKNALILAHYYQTSDVREIADIVGDSFEMAKRAKEAKEELLVICGVRFMAESAKILNPTKTVLLPAKNAGCPMADMITAQDVYALREKHPKAAVVCYVNSSADVKAAGDICCTSSSAVSIVRSLPENQIIFIPDRNLGAYVATQVPEKEIILFEGYCPIHDRITVGDVESAMNAYPGAKLLVHPECRPEVLAFADYIGSTAGIINAAKSSEAIDFIIGTEREIASHLNELLPMKRFYPLTGGFMCPNMKKTRLANIIDVLENDDVGIVLDNDVFVGAARSLERMVG